MINKVLATKSRGVAPRFHEDLLVSCDSFFLQIGVYLWIPHNDCKLLLCAVDFEELSPRGEISGELAQIEASHSFTGVKIVVVLIRLGLRPQEVDLLFNQFQIVRLVKVDEGCLPELLRMHW